MQSPQDINTQTETNFFEEESIITYLAEDGVGSTFYDSDTLTPLSLNTDGMGESNPVSEPNPVNSQAVLDTSDTSIDITGTNSTGITDNDELNSINVDRDFGGNIDEAIASAEDGDVVQLGSNTYNTSGIKLNKDITIAGEAGTIIDGNGTKESIFYLDAGAAGATIQDVEIVNGNNGVYVNGATNVTLQNLDINNMGLSEVMREGQNNSGVFLDYADGFKLIDSEIVDIGRKAVGVNNSVEGTISGLTIQNINLDAQHAQSYDASGIKVFNSHDILIEDNFLRDINAVHIWNDTTNATTIKGNVIEDAGEDFVAPEFNNYVDVSGIYNEKSSNTAVIDNTGTAVEGFLAFKATAFSTETMTMENNDFSSSEINTTDYWVNEEAEKLIASTEDPDEANFDLIDEEFFNQANIGE